LVFWDPEAKLDDTPIKGRRSYIDSEFSPHFHKPIGSFTVTVEVEHSSEPAITRRLTIET
jgi:hypothetical protein